MREGGSLMTWQEDGAGANGAAVGRRSARRKKERRTRGRDVALG
jgi:hypothetical protein